MFKKTVQWKMLAIILPMLFVFLTGFSFPFFPPKAPPPPGIAPPPPGIAPPPPGIAPPFPGIAPPFPVIAPKPPIAPPPPDTPIYDEGNSDYDIDTEYALSGQYTTTQTPITGFIIYHPKQMDGGHPILTWGNGTNSEPEAYEELLLHLASWGFVVIASETPMARSGAEMIEGIDYLLGQNNRPCSLFYGRLDPESIGTIGHSQGGGGAINSALDPRVKCTVPIAPARGDIDQVKCPIFLIAGTWDVLVPPYFVNSTSYEFAEAPTVFGTVEGMNHEDFAGDAGMARGYITAWFMYQLKGDTYAAQAFIGDCEICGNPDWTVKRNF